MIIEYSTIVNKTLYYSDEFCLPQIYLRTFRNYLLSCNKTKSQLVETTYLIHIIPQVSWAIPPKQIIQTKLSSI